MAFLVACMLSIGMQVTTADVRAQVARRGLRWRTLLANVVIVPAIGILLAYRFLPDPGTARAFVLLACTPGGISALQFTTKAKGAAAYAGAVACLLSALGVFLSPLILVLFLPTGDPGGAPIAGAWKGMLSVLTLPLVLGRAFCFLVLFLGAPLGIGMVVKAKAAALAPKLAKGLGLASVVLFVTMVVLLMAPRKAAMQQVGGQAAGVLLVLVLLSMLVGWLLGGPETGTRQILASATSMRNVALAMAIAATFPDAERVLPALIAFSALMVPPNLVLTIVCLVLAARRARRQSAAAPVAVNTTAEGTTSGGPRHP